jgi:hypothetical protein
VPAFHSIPGSVWFGLETSLVALFTIEYVSRCFAWSATWMSLLTWVFCTAQSFFLHVFAYVTRLDFIAFFGIIDLLAIVPYYIELILHQDTVRFLRYSPSSNG